ncbi:MAG: hypothetical protein HXY35_14290 [Chloroflexi bacterium]|nr:hypothetical protein [Chloroflexota bacterium]
MKVEPGAAFDFMSGKLGKIVFRNVNGKLIASRRPIFTSQPTEAQLAHRERFRQAAAYGRSVMADPATRALYQEAADSRGMPIFALIVADYFNAPVIHSIDLSSYAGMANGVITVRALDDFGILDMQIIITDDQGTPLESGAAHETAPGSGTWAYVAQSTLMASTLLIKAVAKDRPGGMTVHTETFVKP